ncbi:MAG: DUF1858 domain-containing protein [Oscillospiraceae bacterium]|nr:DUF1858 domain-containing protein [Oscillospiraceae bacterium]MCC8090052.1 DUF1858 domain-containing protein [Oscillospiraceae bacterium]MCC8157557.1 DUF1858 domain-containing protein [Oscillospiraceae bacterium]MCD7786936.1 DUF1858 domain-containing protein [Oscillospiraceae bacterium]MCD7853726.1 DUF1858 domain-containing protein [Oscillospiraceae bacterium]
MYEVTKDTIISEVMLNAPDTAPMFQAIGMHCLGCAMATGESVAEACAVHGVDADAFLSELNAFIATQEAK